MDLFPKNFDDENNLSKEKKNKWKKVRLEAEQKREKLLGLQKNLETFKRLDSLLSVVDVDLLSDQNYQKEMKSELNTTLLLCILFISLFIYLLFIYIIYFNLYFVFY